MAVDLKILGWSSEGLRCPDHTMSFENGNGSVYKVSLLQMPNGTGKTTTLRLLRAALAGNDMWAEIAEKPIHFRKNSSVKEGRFELRLLFNQRRLTIEIIFDFTTEGGAYTYWTTDSVRGKDQGFKPPHELRSVLKPDFVKLLIFDGELANNLLNPSQTNAQSAIETIYQLNLLHLISRRIDDYWTNAAAQAGSKGSSREFNQRNNKVTTLKARIEYVSEKKDQDTQKLDELKQKIEQMRREFHNEIQKHTEDAGRLSDALNHLNQCEQAVLNKTKEITNLLKNPAEFSASFSNSILSLKDSLDRVQLPGIAAREFFEEIADEQDCICGREITPEIKEVIRSGAHKYLGSEEVGVLNAMKNSIKDRTVKLNDGDDGTLKEMMEMLEAFQQEEQLARQEADAIKESASENDPTMKAIHIQIGELEKECGRLENEILKYDNKTDDSDTGWNLENLNRRYEAARKELAAVTDTKDLKAKRDILCRIMETAYLNARRSINERVCDYANERIKELMPHNQIRIAAIEQSLILSDKEGGSAGETLTVGYAFLSSLLSDKSYRLPAVVDSPSGPIDLKIRKEIAGLIPDLTHQFIAFTISSEREGFVGPLIAAVKEPVNFMTIFRKGDHELDDDARLKTGIVETIDGIIIPGQSYFETFHVDQQ